MTATTDKQMNFKRIQSAIENFRKSDRSGCGMLYTDNWYDSHPRLLIVDPVLNPYDKLVWLAIRAFCSPDMSLTAFPSYDHIQDTLHISRGAVASCIVKLRATRWLTLICREQIRDSSGQITKDGNIYLVHGEPLGLKDTIEFDSNYMEFIKKCKNHRNSDVRKISELICHSIRETIHQNDDIFRPVHSFDRRSDAWASVRGETGAHFFDYRDQSPSPHALHKNVAKNVRPDPQMSGMSSTQNQTQETVVHQVDYGEHVTVVHDVDYGAREPVVYPVDCGAREPVVHQVDYGTKVGSGSKNINNTTTYNYNTDNPTSQKVSSRELKSSSGELEGSSRELVYPPALTGNQIHLVELYLLRLPNASLPKPPLPWTSWEQLLVDELAGRMEVGEKGHCSPVWNPVSLLGTYCNRLINYGLGLKSDGQFQIEHAESVFERRKEQGKYQNAVKKSRENYLRNIDRRIKAASQERK